MKKVLTLFLVFSLLFGLLTGCVENTKEEEIKEGNISLQNEESSQQSNETVVADFSKTDLEMFSDRDKNSKYSEENSVLINLSGTSATSSSNSVKISGGTITITEEATYIISGTLDNGMIIVNAPKTAKLQLVFKDANIISSSSAALYITEADKVFVTLAEGTENSLSNGGTFTAIDENNIDAAVFSKQDLTFNGAGSLKVTSPAGHGIVCKDDLCFTDGSYVISSASHGLDANDSIRVTDATKLTIDAGKDGIHCENSDDASLGFIYISNGALQIEAEGDGIDANAYIQIGGGSFNIVAGGGSVNGSKASSGNYGGFMGGRRPGGSYNRESENSLADENSTSMKGIKAANSLQISGGSFNIDSADDSIHSDVSATINGGVYTVASGDDAFHAEESLTLTNGTINITKCYEGLEALKVNVSGGDIKMVASDDGINAAGGTDSSGITGGRDGMFGGGRPDMAGGGRGGMGGISSNSNGSIKISGGKLYINSSGDGLDANGTLEISGGNVTVVGPTQGDTATLDYDKSGVITGGTFIGTGASGMAQTFSDSKQGVVAVNIGNQSANTEIILKDSKGNEVIAYAPELPFSVVILSSPELVSGESYTLTVGTNSNNITAK